MHRALTAAAVSASLLWGGVAPGFAQGNPPGNAMNYTPLSSSEAQALPSRGGALGMDVSGAQQVNSGGMAFIIMRIKGVRVGTPIAQAGLHAGDQIVAADGHVFPTTAAFAFYVRSLPPGKLMTLDYIPVGGGPQQAQRVGVTVGNGGQAVAPAKAEEAGGLSTGTKLAIGAAAIGLFGCYEMGCFKRQAATQPVAR